MMSRRPPLSRRWLTAASWPIGIVLTSWDYTWRTTVMHRREIAEETTEGHVPPPYPVGVDDSDVQPLESGAGALFHRRYTTRIRDAELPAEALMSQLKRNLNQAAPVKFARFQRVLGDGDTTELGDEFVVRMPGPWDGPVRVIADDRHSFRLATLDGHLEAGQIEFRGVPGEETIGFEIESWARSADWLSNLLYRHARMAKEIQLHMWISFLEGVIDLSGGRIDGGIDIDTRRVDNAFCA